MLEQGIQGAIFAFFIALFSFRFRLLTAEGACVQFVLGWIVLGLGGWQWTVPILFFFLSSSFLSMIGKQKRRNSERLAAKGPTRDAAQVFANGGVAGALVLVNLFVPNPLLYIAYLGAIAASTADTWETEPGTLSGWQPRRILSFERVELGSSGGVTLTGTLGGIAGSTLVSLVALPWISDKICTSLISISLAGLIGSLLDSVFGGLYQLNFRCPACGSISEREFHCELRGSYERGVRWMNNDCVNLFCSIGGAVSGAAFFAVFR